MAARASSGISSAISPPGCAPPARDPVTAADVLAEADDVAIVAECRDGRELIEALRALALALVGREEEAE